MRHPLTWFIACAALACAIYIMISVTGGESGREDGRPERDGHPILFADVTEKAGIRFRQESGATGRKFLVESMGSGVGVLDYDGDGDADIYLVNCAYLEGAGGPSHPRNALYRNDGKGTFTDVTLASGTGDDGFGMGCTMADYDNDGDTDIYVVNWGPNVLYENRGDGTFVEATDGAGVADGGWGVSCLFADADRDGSLDLYVVNYVAASPEDEPECGKPEEGLRTYCHVSLYEAQADVFYKNRGDGTFVDWTKEAGLYQPGGKGLGVIGTDFDQADGIDIYVANDTTPNFLFRNRGDGTFEEVAGLLGTAYGESGLPEAGMGLASGDIDADGWFDIFVTNFAQETNSLYANVEGEFFENRVFLAGLAAPSLVPLGFGTGLLDLDLDGDLDLVVVNGHLEDLIARFYDHQTYAQPNQVFRNRGDGVFEEVSATAGPPFAERWVSRGLASADFDLDGDLDLVINNLGGPARLLENRTGGRGRAVSFLPLTGTPGRAAIGARLVAHVGDRTLSRELSAGGSYGSCSDPWVHFGLGASRRIDRLEVFWPSGKAEEFAGAEAGGRYRIHEGKGAIEPIEPHRR